jgi:hypothetical protein
VNTTLISSMSKGRKTRWPDAFSKKVHNLHASAINMYMTDIKDRILEAANADLQYRYLVEKLHQSERLDKEENYTLEDYGILLSKNILYIPNVQGLKLVILREMHNVTYAGHRGYQKNVAAVWRHYFWPGMKKEIA